MFGLIAFTYVLLSGFVWMPRQRQHQSLFPIVQCLNTILLNNSYSSSSLKLGTRPTKRSQIDGQMCLRHNSHRPMLRVDPELRGDKGKSVSTDISYSVKCPRQAAACTCSVIHMRILMTAGFLVKKYICRHSCRFYTPGTSGTRRCWV